MARQPKRTVSANSAPVGRDTHTALIALQGQALAALRAGHEAYLTAFASNDPDVDNLHRENHRLDGIAARLEARILANLDAERRSLADEFARQAGDLDTALVALQRTVRAGESAGRVAAGLGRVADLLLRLLA